MKSDFDSGHPADNWLPRNDDTTPQYFPKKLPRNSRKRYAHEPRELSHFEYPQTTQDTGITVPTHNETASVRKKRKIKTTTTITVTEEATQETSNVDFQQLKAVIDASLAPLQAYLNALEKRVRRTESVFMPLNEESTDKHSDDDSVTFIDANMIKEGSNDDDHMASRALRTSQTPPVTSTSSHHGREAPKPNPRGRRSAKNSPLNQA